VKKVENFRVSTMTAARETFSRHNSTAHNKPHYALRVLELFVVLFAAMSLAVFVFVVDDSVSGSIIAYINSTSVDCD